MYARNAFKTTWFYLQCLWPFNKNKERIDPCFQQDMAYGKPKEWAKRAQSDKVLRDKAFKIASDSKYDGYQRGLAYMVYKFFDKKI